MVRRITIVVAAFGLLAGVALISTAAPSAGQEGEPARLLATTCEEDFTTALYDVSLASGAGTLIGEITGDGVACPSGIAYGDGTLFGIEGFGGGDGGLLYTIPLGAGDVTVIGDTGLDEACGLAYNPTDGTLWALDLGGSAELWVVPTDGGLSMSVADTGLDLCGLAYDPAVDLLYSIDVDTDELYSIDPDTGDTTLIGDTGFDSRCVAGTVWDTGDNRLLVANGSVTSELLEMPINGDPAESIGDIGAPAVCGLAYLPAIEPPTTTTTAPTTTNTPRDSVRTRPTFTG